MSKLIITFTLSLTVSLILLSLSYFNSINGQYESFSNYENMTLGYKIQYPKSWHISYLPNSANTFFNSSDNSVHVMVGIVPTKKTFEQFSSGLIRNLTNTIRMMNEANSDRPELTRTIETNRTSLSGMDAWRITTIASNDTAYTIWTVKNNYVYSILFGADPASNMVYGPVFQRMVNSFQIIK